MFEGPRHDNRTTTMNQTTFVNTFKEVQNKMYFLAKRLLSSSDEAADAVQEVMVKLWEKKDSLSSINNKEAYAMQMTRNYSLDRLKSKQASHLKIVHNNYEYDERNAQEELERRAQVKLVQKMIKELPEQYKTILELRDIKQYDFESIEQIMGMKSTAVRVSLSRARKMLKEKLESHIKADIA